MKRTAALSESALQEHIVKLLNAYARHDICWWHCPNGDLRAWKVGARLKQAGLRPGVADLNFVIDGRFHALELKTEIGTLSGKQLAFAEDLERAGGIFHSAFGLDQALGVLLAISAFRPGITFNTATALGRGARSPAELNKAQSGTQSPSEVRAGA
jgi:hypothetical protein